MRENLKLPKSIFCSASLITVLLGACGDAPSAVRVSGSTTVLPAISRAAETFEASVIVNAGGSGAGFNQLATGQTDLAMMSRDIKPSEIEAFADHSFTTHVIGRDEVVAVLSSELVDDGIVSLTPGALSGIISGTLTNWSQVGGPDRDILFIDKEGGSGTRQTYMLALMGDADARAPGADLVVGPNNEEQTALMQSDSAIGFLSAAWTNDDVLAVPVLDGDMETRFGRDLVVVSRGDLRAEGQAFLDHLQGEAGRSAVRASGYATP